MAKLRGEQIIAQCFKNEGIDTIFFVVGSPKEPAAPRRRFQLGMQGIYVRHEQVPP